MNYEKIYNDLIQKRRDHQLIKLKKDDPNYIYCERHHIIPVSCHGTNDNLNTINLLPKEHYIAHLLLLKIYEIKYGKMHPYYKNMVCALQLLSNRRIKSEITSSFMEFKIPAYKYQKIRNLYAELKKNSIPWNKGKRNIFSKEKLQEMVKHHKDMHGKNNGMYGRKGKLHPSFGRKHTEATKKLMSKNRKGILRTNEMKKQESIARIGTGNPLYGKIYLYHLKLKKRKFVKPDEILYYRSLGYKQKVGKYKYI